MPAAGAHGTAIARAKEVANDIDCVGTPAATWQGGSEYWGRIRFDFDEEFGGWSGTWGYCDEDPKRTWTGSRAE